MKKVRVNSKYRYDPSPWDRIMAPPYGETIGMLQPGDVVKVINLYGCPKANTMGMCYIATLDYTKNGPETTGTFLGMVMTDSLEPVRK